MFSKHHLFLIVFSQFTSLLPQRMVNFIFLNILWMGKLFVHSSYTVLSCTHYNSPSQLCFIWINFCHPVDATMETELVGGLLIFLIFWLVPIHTLILLAKFRALFSHNAHRHITDLQKQSKIHIVNNLLFGWKSQTLDMQYWPHYPLVSMVRPRFQIFLLSPHLRAGLFKARLS